MVLEKISHHQIWFWIVPDMARGPIWHVPAVEDMCLIMVRRFELMLVFLSISKHLSANIYWTCSKKLFRFFWSPYHYCVKTPQIEAFESDLHHGKVNNGLAITVKIDIIKIAPFQNKIIINGYPNQLTPGLATPTKIDFEMLPGNITSFSILRTRKP